MKNTLILFFLLYSLSTFGQKIKDKKFKAYKFSVGVLGNHKTIGLQGELKFSNKFSFRLVGAKMYGYDRNNEYGFGGLGLVTYYIPTKNKFIEPIISLGGVYSRYHWDLNSKNGDVNDFNIGGGIGTNFRFTKWCRLGINIFGANGFKASYYNKDMRKVGRRFLILPVFTFDILF